MRGEIVLSVGFYPHAAAEHGHGEGVGHDSAEKTALDELHKRKIDLADYVLVVSDVTGYFGESTKDEIRYAVEHGKPVGFTQPAAALRARRLKLPLPGVDITALLESEFTGQPEYQSMEQTTDELLARVWAEGLV
jgi:hypothetical protein